MSRSRTEAGAGVRNRFALVDIEDAKCGEPAVVSKTKA